MSKYKRSPAEYKAEFDAAAAAIKPIADDLAAFARQNGLSYFEANKPVQNQSHWTLLVEIESKDSEEQGRQELSIMMSGYIKPGTVSVRRYVENLADGRKIRSESYETSITELERIIKTVDTFKKHVLANEGLSGKEVTRKKMGTKYYWSFEMNDSSRTWSTEVGELNAAVESYDDGDTWSASVFNSHIDEKFNEKEFDSAKEAIDVVEAYIEEHLKQNPTLALVSAGIEVKNDCVRASDFDKAASVLAQEGQNPETLFQGTAALVGGATREIIIELDATTVTGIDDGNTTEYDGYVTVTVDGKVIGEKPTMMSDRDEHFLFSPLDMAMNHLKVEGTEEIYECMEYLDAGDLVNFVIKPDNTFTLVRLESHPENVTGDDEEDEDED